MKKLLLIWVCLLPAYVDAGPLEEALAIVIAKSESIQAKQRTLGLNRNASNWSSKVKLAAGYSEKQTDEFAPGFDERAQLTFEYPLTGAVTQTDKDKAQAMSALYETQENVTRSFILEVQKLALLKADMDGANRTHDLAMDLLKRAKQNNDEAAKAGRVQEQMDITALIDRAINAENAARKAVANFRTMLEALCRISGKDEWVELRTHTIDYLKTMGEGRLIDVQPVTQETQEEVTQPAE